MIERVCLHPSYACAPFEQIQLLTDMVSSQMRESLALDNGCTLAAYPCRPAAVRGRPAAVRGIRARVVSFNNIHQSDHAFVVAAMYSASVGIGGLVRIKTDLVVQHRQRAPEGSGANDETDQRTAIMVR